MPEDKKKKKPSLGERMLITGMAGANQHARSLEQLGVLKIQESDKTGLVIIKDDPAKKPSRKKSNPLKKALKK